MGGILGRQRHDGLRLHPHQRADPLARQEVSVGVQRRQVALQPLLMKTHLKTSK
jgi:hypothetical protein